MLNANRQQIDAMRSLYACLDLLERKHAAHALLIHAEQDVLLMRLRKAVYDLNHEHVA